MLKPLSSYLNFYRVSNFYFSTLFFLFAFISNFLEEWHLTFRSWEVRVFDIYTLLIIRILVIIYTWLRIFSWSFNVLVYKVCLDCLWLNTFVGGNRKRLQIVWLTNSLGRQTVRVDKQTVQLSRFVWLYCLIRIGDLNSLLLLLLIKAVWISLCLLKWREQSTPTFVPIDSNDLVRIRSTYCHKVACAIWERLLTFSFGYDKFVCVIKLCA